MINYSSNVQLGWSTLYAITSLRIVRGVQLLYYKTIRSWHSRGCCKYVIGHGHMGFIHYIEYVTLIEYIK
jgi:hypothetical protein